MRSRRALQFIINLGVNYSQRFSLAQSFIIHLDGSIRHHHKMSQPQPQTQPQPQDENYALALARLSQLQSNLAVTSLFNPPKNDTTDNSKKEDLNALAIPEMLDWLRRAGYTPSSLAESGLRCVHVAGTKGKGSVSALVAGVLREYVKGRVHDQVEGAEGVGEDGGEGEEVGKGAEGLVEGDGERKVGLYTSPHVIDVRERIVLNGNMISKEPFAKYVNSLWARFTSSARAQAAAQNPPLILTEDQLTGPATKPFYFRFLTILALHTFLQENALDAVIECGIGGEYDATNVLPAEAVTAAVVTQLGIDHVGMLGDTVEKISWHKAGVFKPGVKAFTRRLPGEGQQGVMEVLRERAKEKGATLVEVGDEEVERWEGVEGARLQGPFQKYNMALAVYAAREHLIRTGVKFEGRFGTDEWELGDIPEEFVRGLRGASLRARCEVLMDVEGVEWCLDGAHTEDSLAGVGRWFAGRVEAEDGLRVLVFNQQERDVAVLLRALMAGTQEGPKVAPVFTHAIFTRNEERKPAEGETRDLSAQDKAQETMQSIDASTVTATETAVEASVEYVRKVATQAKRDGKACKVLVTGSFHLVGAVLKSINHVEF